MLSRMRGRLHCILSDEIGATITEYGMLVIGIIVVGGLALNVFLLQLQDMFSMIGESITAFRSDIIK